MHSSAAAVLQSIIVLVMSVDCCVFTLIFGYICDVCSRLPEIFVLSFCPPLLCCLCLNPRLIAPKLQQLFSLPGGQSVEGQLLPTWASPFEKALGRIWWPEE
jgi:hypothetical protein